LWRVKKNLKCGRWKNEKGENLRKVGNLLCENRKWRKTGKGRKLLKKGEAGGKLRKWKIEIGEN